MSQTTMSCTLDILCEICLRRIHTSDGYFVIPCTSSHKSGPSGYYARKNTFPDKPRPKTAKFIHGFCVKKYLSHVLDNGLCRGKSHRFPNWFELVNEGKKISYVIAWCYPDTNEGTCDTLFSKICTCGHGKELHTPGDVMLVGKGKVFCRAEDGVHNMCQCMKYSEC